jgi:phospholipase C
VANAVDNTVSVLLGNGDGTLQGHVDYAAGMGPAGIVVGDFNGDGKLDVAVANAVDNTVSVLLGNGDGTFQAHLDYPTDAGPQAVTAGDWNKDGRMDLATANRGANTVAMLLQAAAVALSSTTVGFGNQTVGTTSAPQNIILTNSGSLALSVTSVSLGGSNSVDFSETDNCNSSSPIAPGGACMISISFTPSIPGPQTASLLVFSNGMNSPQTVTFSGTGTAPTALLSSTAVTFGPQNVGTTSAIQIVSLTNQGNAQLNITGISLTGANAGDFAETDTCGRAVAAGGNCRLSVSFTPTTTGTRSEAISINDDAPGRMQTVTLSGTGTAPSAAISTTKLVFGNQNVGTASASQAVTVTNQGSGPLTIVGISVGPNFVETDICGPFPSSFAPGSACAIQVSFVPSATGAISGTLLINDNAAGSPQSVALSGTGVAPVASLSPTSLSFSSQVTGTASSAKTITLKNAGTASMLISGIAITGANSGDYTKTATCSGALAIGASCTINVIFTPAALGTRTAAVTITDNAAGGSQSVALTGTGIAPVTLSASTLSFGNQAQGTTSTAKTLSLQNNLGTAVTIMSITTTGVNSGDFNATNSCGTSLGAKASCTISVTFSPAQATARNATLVVSDSASNSPQSAGLTGTGLLPLTLSPAGLFFGNQLAGTTSIAKSVVLKNNLSGPLSLASIVAAGDYVEGSTCGTSVPAGGSCNINVQFAPTAVGPRNGTITISDNTVTSPQVVTLTGTGTAPVTFSSSSLAFSNQDVGTSSATKSVSLKNSLGTPLAILNIVTSGDYLTTSTCGSSVAAGGSCTLTVRFAPTAPGTRSGTITINDSAVTSPQVFPLTGTGLAPITFSPSNVVFPDQVVYTRSAAQNVTLTGTGNLYLNISSVSITGAYSNDFTILSTCGKSLAVGATCTFTLTFAPAGAGSRTAALVINTNLGNIVLGISGTGTPAPPPPAGMQNIQQVVFIVKENRTFDNYFGTFPGANGATSGTISTGQVIPIGHTPDVMPRDLGHDWNAAHVVVDGGKMDKFDLGNGNLNGDYLAYSQYSQPDLPNYWTYATTFALGDNMFSSLNGPSFPNHLYTVGAQSGGAINNPVNTNGLEWGCDPDETGTVQVMDSTGNISNQPPCFDFQTLADSLLAANVSWGYYAPTKGQPGYIWSALDAVKHVRLTSMWTQNVFPTARFVTDALNGNLPAVSWLVADFPYSEHPPFSACQGENWTVQQINAIMQGPQWNSTAVFITWDDYGGFYDHVPPPNLDNFGYGPRVPLLIISPYAKGGYVSHTQYEFSSLLRFVELRFGLQPLTSRDSGAGDMTDSFNFSQAPLAPLNLGQRNCPSFSITPSQSSVSVTRGQSVSLTIKVTPINGYNQPVPLYCSGGSSVSTCSLSPASVGLDGVNSRTSTLTITTTSATAKGTLTIYLSGNVADALIQTVKILVTVN